VDNVSHKVSHPFDWTFTTDYRGTLVGDWKSVAATDLRIDMEKLKQKEAIVFFDEIHLYEDELADHGCASCSIKVVRTIPIQQCSIEDLIFHFDIRLFRGRCLVVSLCCTASICALTTC